MSCYAVKNGREIGVFYTWKECESQVKGYSGAEYKKFDTEQDAYRYIGIKEMNSRMNNQKIEWFGIECNKKNIISNDYNYCKKKAKELGHRIKGFRTQEEAYKYYDKNGKRTYTQGYNRDIASKKQKRKKPYSQKICTVCCEMFVGDKGETMCQECTKVNICLACEKPFSKRGELCPACQAKKVGSGLSIKQIIAIRNLHPGEDVFEYAKNHKEVFKEISIVYGKNEWEKLTIQEKNRLRSARYKSIAYEKEEKEEDFPAYIKNIFKNDETKELLYLEGNKLNPKIYYLCKLCGEEQCQEYNDLKTKKSHNCTSSKSSGEIIVENFLKKIGVTYKKQRDTLICINPKTKKALPYDFELPNYKVIIEVQGNQHNNFIPHFHGTEENFEYQQWKDKFKKEFAEKKGYKVLYIDYDEIKNGIYKVKINELINNKNFVILNIDEYQESHKIPSLKNTTKIGEKRKPKDLELDYKISFGKYKGEKLVDIYKSDTNYVNWIENNVKNQDYTVYQIKLLKKYI